MDNDKILELLMELSQKMGALETLPDEMHQVRRQMDDMQNQINESDKSSRSIEKKYDALMQEHKDLPAMLSSEEVIFLREVIREKREEREFWKEQKAKIATAGIIAVCGIVGTALWYYAKHLIINGTGGGSPL